MLIKTMPVKSDSLYNYPKDVPTEHYPLETHVSENRKVEQTRLINICSN
jgi:hypothetical protein